MKKSILFILAALFLFINCLPSSIVLAHDSAYTDSQLADVGTLMLTSLISSGEATELDFSDYTENNGLDFLISFGELAVTGDPSGLIDQGLTWLGGEIDDAYQSLIEDIRAWEHDISPDLYNWWYNGTQYEYKLQPNTHISRPLSNILRNPNSNAIANPDINYESYINLINGTNGNGYDFFWANYTTWDGSHLITETPKNYSWAKMANVSGYLVKHDRPFDTAYMLPFPVFTVDIYSDNNNVYHLKLVNYSGESQGINMSGNYVYKCYANNVKMVGSSPETKFNQFFLNNYELTSGTLTDCFDYAESCFRNVNIYVNGVAWSIVAQNSPINIPGKLTVLNNQPAIYNYPQDTYIDINGLKTLITNAINNSDILTWQDIDDYFLDINGQQAFPVVNIYRNDYDNMYIEQYPYPAKLIGMQEPLTFNEHLLDNYYGQYLTPMVDLASNTVDVLPGEIKWVLGIGTILMIFAVIINRLLE